MKIIIVGGGAGGLELATYLGKKLGRKQKADIVLIDRNPTHVWKPLLHEVAAGSLDAEMDSVSYRAHGQKQGFRFKLGTLCNVDSDKQQIHLAPVCDEDGEEILPERFEQYDKLVLAIGSQSNDFNVPGVAEHCRFLDSTQQAIKFHNRLVNKFIHLNRQLIDNPEQTLKVAIVGGGATGVELTAELFNARELFALYGLDRITDKNLQVTLLEAGPRLLPALSERISSSVLTELNRLGANVQLNAQVAKADQQGFITTNEQRIDADIMLWAAGVKVPAMLSNIAGVETNRIGQIIVNQHLQSQGNQHIYAIGDCAGFALENNRWVPPRAQSAHQMASVVGKNIVLQLLNKPLVNFTYKDKGSLISLSERSTVGVLMGNLAGASNSINIQGKLARLAYISLYRMHQFAVHGWLRASLMIVADKINHIIRPRLKLH